jgi:glycine/D-amino acid oxidase-like deaminating enzyme
MTGGRRYDVAVIGGGIVGMATAMALTQRSRASVVVLGPVVRCCPFAHAR